ncbi:hypothetical protein C1H46_030061 [Malus baccata]|uniref:Uncharacterized protein n=1 Tax=Malus baccata TaxID=106549 RepID=A0A540LD49_MALBA|nr:hypothetical protein C1H46_030061 [Malus baccata]
MDSAARRSGGGLFEGLYRVIMRRNSVYVTFVIAGAFLGERENLRKLKVIDLRLGQFSLAEGSGISIGLCGTIEIQNLGTLVYDFILSHMRNARKEDVELLTGDITGFALLGTLHFGCFFSSEFWGAVDYGVHKLWEYNNVGKRYEDISVLGTRQSEE